MYASGRMYVTDSLHTTMNDSISLALTFDDVLIVPRRSSFSTRGEANTRSRLTKKVTLNIPIVSANMETVTESAMAITLARLGGIGFIHRFMSIEENAEQIKRVKRAQSFIIDHPYTIEPDRTIANARDMVAQYGVSGLLVVARDGTLRGVLSSRDFFLARDGGDLVLDVMTPREKLIVGTPQTSFEDARTIFLKEKIEKLPLVDESDHVVGLITSADIENVVRYPLANTDLNGRLVVGGSVGVHGDYCERAQELVKAGADVLVIDIAHGHSDLMFQAIKNVRDVCGSVQLVAGNIATPDAARELCEAGVDALKVGIGPGATCITREVTGCGVPQLTAILQTAEVAKKYGVPIIADGGIQKSGDIVKALGAGADSVMIGSLFAGTHESPGVIMKRDGRKYKIYRGSASLSVAQKRKNIDQEKKDLENVVPEGIEAIVPYKGPIEDMIREIVGGLRSGMSYTNSRTIEELQNNAKFVQITSAGKRESGPHDVGDMK